MSHVTSCIDVNQSRTGPPIPNFVEKTEAQIG